MGIQIDGTNDNISANDGNWTATGLTLQNPSGGVITSATAQSASGTFIDFTSIPSWVKRVTVMGSSVSTSGTSVVIVQLGTSGAFVTSGYLCGNQASTVTTGFPTSGVSLAAAVRHFMMTIMLIDGNTWVGICSEQRSDSGVNGQGGGSIALGGVLTRLRLTTVNGTDTFDAGTVNITYE